MTERLIQGGNSRASLVKLPTGTGKTGVLAVASCLLPGITKTLIVAPFAGIRDQIQREIQGRFWEALQVEPPNRQVRTFVPSTCKSVLQSANDAVVFLCTIQSLQTMYDNNHEEYKMLANQIDLVMFDEGHREPAPKWALAVRGLKKPTVVLTATPYRNDYKTLNFDKSLTTNLSFHDAVRDRFVRRVEFRELRHNGTAEAFVDKLLDTYHGQLKALKPKDVDEPRVIVRCDSKDSVTRITSLLSQRGEKVIGIHHDYDDEDLHSHLVPDPLTTEATFWVHQWKLLEGIDDPRFFLLAIFDRLNTGRSLVQQIGRIIRNPKREPDATAFVLHNPDHGQDVFWENYLAYERQPDITGIEAIRDSLHSGYVYLNGNYRLTFDMHLGEVFKSVSYPLSALVYQIPTGFSQEKLLDRLTEEWISEDRTGMVLHRPDNETYFYMFGSYQNAPVLRDRIFLQYSLGFTIWRVKDSVVYFYDSGGMTPEYLRKTARRISPVQLRKLLWNADRFSSLSLANTDLGVYSIRRRSMTAYALEQTAPGLFDHGHVCTTASALLKADDNGETPRIRRYVGFTRGRVTDSTSQTVSYSEYIQWLDRIHAKLSDRNDQKHEIFRRFSQYSDPPTDPTPRNIMVDLGLETEWYDSSGGRALEVNELCVPVQNNRFGLVVHDKTYTVEIKYIKERSEYEVTSAQLATTFTRSTPGPIRRTENLISYLNRTQSFRVVPETPGYIFAHGHFLSTNLGLRNDLDLTKVMAPVQALDSVTGEKGIPAPGTGGDRWADDSVFGVIDNNVPGSTMEGIMRGFNLMVCDDLDKEIADFIAVDEKLGRFVLIHAKFGFGAQRSASVFAQVCGQAVKNLHYLEPQLTTKPEANIKKWNRQWRDPDVGVVANRMRREKVTGAEFWKRAYEVLRNPNTTREVWVVMGAGFKKSEFDRLRRGLNPPPEVVQIYYQLASTWAAVSSVGGRFTLMCSP